jgi:hypothetical protein
MPLVFLPASVKEKGAHRIMTVSEQVGLDDDFLPDDSLDGEAAAIDFGRNPFDNHPAAAVAVCFHAVFFSSNELDRFFLAEGHGQILFNAL